jgi:hypothetical protein
MSAQLAIQETIFQLLSNDVALTTKISGVFDSHPDPQVFPYVTIGDGYANSFSTFDRVGEEVYSNVHVWSRYKGFKESQDIAQDVHRLLSQKHVDVDGFGTVACFFEASDTLRDSDGITRHLILRFRFIIQH